LLFFKMPGRWTAPAIQTNGEGETMDLKVYYRKIREHEASIEGTDALLVSLETPDGGKAGVHTEAPRLLAAQILADGRARMATPEEKDRYDAAKAAAKQAADDAAEISKVRIALVSEAELRAARGSGKPSK
jgi:hypothetical protein